MADAAQSTTLPIQETFVSVQGEGTLVGTPSRFIRVSGCNLRCAWCDSPKTSWEPEKTTVPLDELVEQCKDGPRHVVLTGGEPLLFPGIARLSQRLRERGHHVTIETAATVWLEGLECDLLSASPKLAHSTPWERAPQLADRHEQRRLALDVLGRMLERYSWQLKFVVRAHDPGALDADLEEIEDLVQKLSVPVQHRDRVLLMPECIDQKRLSADYRALVPALQKTGFRLGERLHIELFGHTPKT